jgi:lipoprotein-anchoring transpeptidase ErfK/SrfK
MHRGHCRPRQLLHLAVSAMIAMVATPVAVVHADDEPLPTMSFTTTSGAPLHNGATYGVGTVVVARFDAPVGDRRAAEQALQVTTSPPVGGAWYWVDNEHAHWRPPQYYAPGTGVSVAIGQGDPVNFTIGNTHVAVADDATKQVSVFDNGALVRTMPTSMGRGGTDTVNGKTISFWTPPGVYTVMDKSNPVVMDSSTYGLPINSHLGYKESIPYAVRISADGIYLHELDATVWAQGNTDTSHGCLNLNGANAKWYYDFSIPGDVVEVKNSGGKPVSLWQNGDWSVPWDQWSGGAA